MNQVVGRKIIDQYQKDIICREYAFCFPDSAADECGRFRALHDLFKPIDHARTAVTSKLRNIAIIAQVDHGKTTLVHKLLRQSENFEKVLGEDRYKTFQWYKMGLDRAQGVAQIVNRVGSPKGTGFLVRGSDIHTRIADEWVLLTNAHVVSDDPNEQAAVPGSLPPDEARIRFEARPGPAQEYRVAELVFTSRRNELDCTVLKLTPTPAVDEPYPISKYPPRLDGKQRVYVIGHPKGGGHRVMTWPVVLQRSAADENCRHGDFQGQ